MRFGLVRDEQRTRQSKKEQFRVYESDSSLVLWGENKIS